MYRIPAILAVPIGLILPAHAADDGGGTDIVFLIAAAVVGLLYFLPSVCAFKRGHHQRAAILALNILAGWTAIGWVAAFVWAFTEVRSQIKT